MKRIIWIVFVIIGMCTWGQAQIHTPQLERQVQDSVTKQDLKTVFCILTGLCAEKQNESYFIDEKQVEEHMQTMVDQQDLAMHELYTQNYLKQAREKGASLGITRDGKDARKLNLLGDFYLFEEAEDHGKGVINNFYTHPRGNQTINILLGEKSSVEAEMRQRKDLLKEIGFVLQTYDLRSADEGMISFYKQRNTSGHYIVFRVFRTATGEVVSVNIARTLSQKNLVIMRAMYQALQQTDKKVLTEHFVTRECKLGADCY